MLILKICSVLFATLLLYPFARVFYEMARAEPDPAEVEEFGGLESSEENPFADEGVMGVTVVAEYSMVSPAPATWNFLGYGSRRWVGFVGGAAITLGWALLVYSALSPRLVTTHTEIITSEDPPTDIPIFQQINPEDRVISAEEISEILKNLPDESQ